MTKHRDDRKATFDSAQENDDKANLDLATARESETFAVHEAAIIRDEKIEDARLHRDAYIADKLANQRIRADANATHRRFEQEKRETATGRSKHFKKRLM